MRFKEQKWDASAAETMFNDTTKEILDTAEALQRSENADNADGVCDAHGAKRVSTEARERVLSAVQPPKQNYPQIDNRATETSTRSLRLVLFIFFTAHTMYDVSSGVPDESKLWGVVFWSPPGGCWQEQQRPLDDMYAVSRSRPVGNTRHPGGDLEARLFLFRLVREIRSSCWRQSCRTTGQILIEGVADDPRTERHLDTAIDVRVTGQQFFSLTRIWCKRATANAERRSWAPAKKHGKRQALEQFLFKMMMMVM